MSRSALTTWIQRVQKRLARGTGQTALAPEALETAVERVARKLRVDPVILLGALAAKPIPTSLWNEVLHGFVQSTPREEDWSAMTTAAEVVAGAFPNDILMGWMVEPSQPADVYVLAACMALHAEPARLELVATLSDPRMVEIGRSGLVPDATMLRTPVAIQQHFRQLGRCWQALPDLRAAVRFECAPACELPGMQQPNESGGYHLIVSRGQLVRLDPLVARRMALRLYRALRAEGFLMVGPGDHDDRLFGELEPFVAPGLLLYRKGLPLPLGTRTIPSDFAGLLSAVEADPVAWEPRWQLACLLLREGYAESAMAHLRELARWRPEFPGVWQTLAKAYTLAGDTAAASTAHDRAALAAASAGAPKMLM